MEEASARWPWKTKGRRKRSRSPRLNLCMPFWDLGDIGTHAGSIYSDPAMIPCHLRLVRLLTSSSRSVELLVSRRTPAYSAGIFAGSGQIAPAWVPIPPRSQMGMHWLRRGERDLFRLPFVLHGHQEILQVLKRKPRKGNFENRTFRETTRYLKCATRTFEMCDSHISEGPLAT